VNPLVSVVMGSDSDLPTMVECVKALQTYEISYEVLVLSAHRSPEQTTAFARQAEARGVRVIVAGAGGAAHLAGVIAAHTSLPVIGVPIDSSPLAGFDSLLSTVQMPPGVPVATVGVGKMGAKNAAHLAARILALESKGLSERVKEKQRQMTEDVLKIATTLPAKLKELLDKKA
jgi:phosphoribosylaminoimidazole carboxylase PurE protein